MEENLVDRTESQLVYSLAEMPENIRSVLSEQHCVLERKIELAEIAVANPQSTRAELEQVVHSLCKELHRLAHFITLQDSVTAQLCDIEQSCAAEKAKYANENREIRLASLEERVHRKSYEEHIRANYDKDVLERATELLDEHTKQILDSNTLLKEEKLMLAEELHKLRADNIELQKINAELKEKVEAAHTVQSELTARSVRQKRTIAALKKQLSLAEEKTTELVKEYDTKLSKERRSHNKQITPLTKANEDAQRQARQLHAELTRVRELASRVMESRTELEQFFYDALAEVKVEVIAERRRALAHIPCGVSANGTTTTDLSFRDNHNSSISNSNSHTKSSLLRLECRHKRQERLHGLLKPQHEPRLLLTDAAHVKQAKELLEVDINNTLHSNSNKVSVPAFGLPHSVMNLLPECHKRQQWTLDKKGFPTLASTTTKQMNSSQTKIHTQTISNTNALTEQERNMQHAQKESVNHGAIIVSEKHPLPPYLAHSTPSPSNVALAIKECQNSAITSTNTSLPLLVISSSASSAESSSSSPLLEISPHMESKERTDLATNAEFAQRMTLSQWRDLQKDLQDVPLTSSNALSVVKSVSNVTPSHNVQTASESCSSNNRNNNTTSNVQEEQHFTVSAWNNALVNSQPTLGELQCVKVCELNWAEKERVIQYLFYLLQHYKRSTRCRQITSTATTSANTTCVTSNAIEHTGILLDSVNNQHDSNNHVSTDHNNKDTEFALPDDHVFLTQGAVNDVE